MTTHPPSRSQPELSGGPPTIGMKNMQLKYDVSLEDLIAFNGHFASTSGVVNFRRSAAIQGIGVGATLFFLVLATTNNFVAAGAAGTVVGLFVFIAWPSVHRDHLRRSIPKIVRKLQAGSSTDGVLGGHTLDLEPAGLVDRTGVNETHQGWIGLQHIDVTPDHVFIYTSATGAFVVPRNAIPDFPAFLEVVSQNAGAGKIRRYDASAA